MIKQLIAHLLANGVALYFVGIILKGDFIITGEWKGYLIAALIFGILNGMVKPVLKLLSLPFVLITGGLFIFVINSLMVWFAQYALNVLKFEGVAILIKNGFFTYILVGFLISVFNMVIHWLLKK
ncbi:phage holin family protein [Candidatus Peregrinibacteria bacterium]|nr:phage holin family protein [Candidatus Peregrinibacteria bacterium]